MIELRTSPEYQQAKVLLSEKKQIQARLREVDRMLRKLDILQPGTGACARKDLEQDHLLAHSGIGEQACGQWVGSSDVHACKP
ncbi:hypothetical protein [Janthinobacterium sp.]|uniref:hypothetical protein n=1 Tax=Janthinobacterium sp. TaxID=1871054 RepID=UPI00293D6669|nr:hypothetical protein [Janthinobacterium sp.]